MLLERRRSAADLDVLYEDERTRPVVEITGVRSAYRRLLTWGRKWMAADPANIPLNSVAVLLLSRDKQHDQAVRLAESWLALAEKRAAATTQPATTKKPALTEAVQRVVVQVLLRAERKEEALKRARAYDKASPNRPTLMRALMGALQANEFEAEYVRLLERIFALDEDDVGVNNDLGYCWADQGVNLTKAEYMIRKALGAKPQTVAFQDSLGWVLYKQGKFAAAQRVFAQAVKGDPSELHSIILDHAGDTNWRLGRKTEAIRHWKLAVRMAKKDDMDDRETRQVRDQTPLKIKAAESGASPRVAPLGKGVPEPDGK